MLYVLDDGTIRLTRGDTARLSTVISNGATGQPYEIQPNDVLTLTVKKTVKDLEPRFQKNNNRDERVSYTSRRYACFGIWKVRI